MESLHGWLFTYNSMAGLWMATTRDNYHLLFSDFSNPLVLRSSKFETLQELIIKTDGDEDRLKKLLS